MNSLLSKSALYYYQKDLFVAEIIIALTIIIRGDSCTKYRLVSRQYQVSPVSQTAV